VGSGKHEDSSALFGDVKPAALIVGRDDLDRMVQSGDQGIEHQRGGRGEQHRCGQEECVHENVYGRRPGGVEAVSHDSAPMRTSGWPLSKSSLRREWIECLDFEDCEVTNVSRHDHQTVHDRRGGDQRVLEQVVRSAMHQLCPGPKDSGIDWKNVPCLRDVIDPHLDLGSLVRVALASDLDASLQLATVMAER
jgi:hypothetical protein